MPRPAACAGGIATGGQSDAWTFAAQAGSVVTIRLLQEGGASLPPRLRLIDPSGAEIANVCSGPESEARVQNFKLPFAGDYVVRASGCFGDSLGGYRLSVISQPEALSIAFGGEATGEIRLTADYRDWRFEAQGDETVTIRALQDGGASLPPRIRLIDPSGAEIANVCSGPESEARIQNLILRFAGTYTIRVSGCFGNSLGGFRLLLTKSSPSPIAFDHEVAGEIALSGDYDDWLLEAAAGDVVTVHTVEEGAAWLPARIRVFDPSGAEIANRCGEEARVESLTLRFAGTYTVRISGCFDDSLGLCSAINGSAPRLT